MKATWIMLTFIDILSFWFISFKAGSIIFILGGLYILWEIGVFTGVNFSKALFKECEVYYYEYVGEYFLMGKEFEKLSLIVKKLNADALGFEPFAAYYDDPKLVDPKSCRAVIGLMRKNLEAEMSRKQEEVVNYLKSNSFKRSTIPETESIYSSFPMVNTMSMVIGNKKVNTALHANLENENWKKLFNLKESRISCSVEVLGKKSLEFFVPLKNRERFELHSLRRR